VIQKQFRKGKDSKASVSTDGEQSSTCHDSTENSDSDRKEQEEEQEEEKDYSSLYALLLVAIVGMGGVCFRVCSTILSCFSKADDDPVGVDTFMGIDNMATGGTGGGGGAGGGGGIAVQPPP